MALSKDPYKQARQISEIRRRIEAGRISPDTAKVIVKNLVGTIRSAIQSHHYSLSVDTLLRWIASDYMQLEGSTVPNPKRKKVTRRRYYWFDVLFEDGSGMKVEAVNARSARERAKRHYRTAMKRRKRIPRVRNVSRL